MTPYDHPEWAGFVAAVRANPADDTVRLIAADWLDERGEGERAELIRLECRRAAAGRCDHPGIGPRSWGAKKYRGRCESCRLIARWRELTDSRSRDLAAGVRPLTPSGGGGFLGEGDTSWEWHRGFVTAVTCRADHWLAHGDAVLAREPVERVALTSYPPYHWFMNNLPPHWPAGSRSAPVERPVALDALEHCWPGVAFTLPPEPDEAMSFIAARNARLGALPLAVGGTPLT